jgi:hypothetical protein
MFGKKQAMLRSFGKKLGSSQSGIKISFKNFLLSVTSFFHQALWAY